MKDLRQTFERIWQTYSGEAGWQTVVDLCRFHRIQASPGYREAAEMVHRRLAQAGLDAGILSYPANERSSFWALPSFQEWDCSEATLHLVAPQEEGGVLADFRACPTSFIQRSTPFARGATTPPVSETTGPGTPIPIATISSNEKFIFCKKERTC